MSINMSWMPVTGSVDVLSIAEATAPEDVAIGAYSAAAVPAEGLHYFSCTAIADCRISFGEGNAFPAVGAGFRLSAGMPYTYGPIPAGWYVRVDAA